ncbi:hypothetical protein PILCRDRAFT_796736 [Piloderma croceum F 1598]|uniref:Uncharacterized protein n=1 Tax=Piloderma croceum (strain F 1598) TaxID=765440 RepID=A0A0C3BHQ3_PILCF|nr:hypothetical protein PILCRDRAFT_796736 [Piloderma croceum F 1598]
MKTSAYVQITGHLNQSSVGLASNDTGSELDPHGANLAGNPLSGLVCFKQHAYNNCTKTQYIDSKFTAVKVNSRMSTGTYKYLQWEKHLGQLPPAAKDPALEQQLAALPPMVLDALMLFLIAVKSCKCSLKLGPLDNC